MIIKKILISFEAQEKIFKKHNIKREEIERVFFDVSEISCWFIDQQTMSAFIFKRQYISEHAQELPNMQPVYSDWKGR